MAKDHKLIVGCPGPQMAKSLAWSPVENKLYLLPALVCPQGLRTVGHLVGVGLIKEQTLARLKLKEVKR